MLETCFRVFTTEKREPKRAMCVCSAGGCFSPSWHVRVRACVCVFCVCVFLQNFITRDDIIAYAEEGGDFAQLKEVDACMEVGELHKHIVVLFVPRYIVYNIYIRRDKSYRV